MTLRDYLSSKKNIRFCYEARNGNTKDYDYGYDSILEALKAAPKNWKVSVYSYDINNEEGVARAVRNGFIGGVNEIIVDRELNNRKLQSEYKSF